MLLAGGGELGEGHHRSQMGKECSEAEGANLSHDEVIGHLKLALQVVGDIKGIGKVEEGSSGATGLSSNNPSHC